MILVRRLPVMILAVLGVLLGHFPSMAEESRADINDPAALEAFLDGVISTQLKQYHIAGATVAVVKDGALLLAKGYGFADLEEGPVAVDPGRTLFRPGSVSKLITWTAVMQLVEKGQLDLDTDINCYLDFSIPARLLNQGGNEPPRPITLADLMAHTAGFEEVGLGVFVRSAKEVLPLGEYLKEFLPERVYPPGELGAYSNYGAALAGYIVERVSGMPFAGYVEKNIFAPLGMEHSTFRQPLPAALAGQMARGYNYVDGVYLPGEFEYIQPYPAGSLSSTASDMARFMIAHLQEGRYGDVRILKEASTRLMHERHFSHHPRLPGMAHGFFESYINGRRIIFHEGDTFLFHSGLYLLPGENIGIFVSYNSPTASLARNALLPLFMDYYFPGEHNEAPPLPANARERARLYQGEFHLSRTNYTTVEKIMALLTSVRAGMDDTGRLLLTAGGETKRYVEIEPGLLQTLEGEELIAARFDQAGRASHLLTEGPFVFIRTPWYAGVHFTALFLALSALLWFGTLAGWIVGLFRARKKKSLLTYLARLAAGLFGIVFMLFLFFLAAALGAIDPVYNVPGVFLGLTPLMKGLLAVPLSLVILGAAMLVCTVLVWWKGCWEFGARIHYTLLTLIAAVLLTGLHYWNIF